MKNSRRAFIRNSSLTASAVLLARAGFSASSYNRIIGCQRPGSCGCGRIFRQAQIHTHALFHESL